MIILKNHGIRKKFQPLYRFELQEFNCMNYAVSKAEVIYTIAIPYNSKSKHQARGKALEKKGVRDLIFNFFLDFLINFFDFFLDFLKKCT